MAQSTQPDLSRLRALAQNHLVEIEEARIVEASQQEKATIELAQYAKPNPRTGTPSSQSQRINDELESDDISRAKLRPVQDIINRLRWDPSVNKHEYSLGYLDRFEGLRERKLMDWIDEKTDEEFIPLHRVKQVIRTPEATKTNLRAEIIWHRDERVDLIFVSGLSAAKVIHSSNNIST